jgi:hypothetical protein
MNVVPEMWQFAEGSVHEEGCFQFEPIKSAKKFIQTKTEECFSYIAEYEDKTIIAFRGTKNNVKSWILNFSVYPLKGDKQIQHFKDELVHTQTKEKGIIHKGFYSIWEQSKKMIDDYVLSMRPDQKICVTGMSQGGAIATICARHLAKNRNIEPKLITFAAPAQGTLDYVTQVNELVKTHYRVVNGYDIVTFLPPIEAGFIHAGMKLELYTSWWHRFFLSCRIKEHYYSSYTKSLLKRFTKPDEQEALKEVLKRVPF